MIKIPSQLRYHLPFFLILVVAIFLRVYKLPILTTFGRDQGIDFLTVREMIVTRRPTLLGIKVSLADFHQGPVYLYLLLPLFMLFKLHPLAGPVTAVIIAGLTLVALYLFMAKFFGRSAAVLSSLLFAVSPELVKQGNTPLYQHFLSLTIILSFWALFIFLEAQTKFKKRGWAVILGVLVGISLELHFLAIILCLALPLFILVKDKKQWRYLPIYLAGLIIGTSPTILFEVRHQFLNTHLLWQYLGASAADTTLPDKLDKLMTWIIGAGNWFGAEQLLGGGIILVMSSLGLIGLRLTQPRAKALRQLFVITTIVTLLFQLVMTSFISHYALPVWLLLIILFPLWLTELARKNKPLAYLAAAIIIIANLSAVSSHFSQNHGYAMPAGWSLNKILAAAIVIKEDSLERQQVNVASLLDGDTRAYPLRYTLAWQQVKLEAVEKYPDSLVLYVVTKRTREQLMNSSEWEIAAFQPAVVGQEWDMGDQIKLYRLEKANF